MNARTGCDSVRLARKQHGMCGISKINTTVPTEVTDADMKFLGRYVVLLYSRTLQLTEVNEARQQLFSFATEN